MIIPTAEEMVKKTQDNKQSVFDELAERVFKALDKAKEYEAVVAINKGEEAIADEIVKKLRELGYGADFEMGDEICVDGIYVCVVGKIYINWEP